MPWLIPSGLAHALDDEATALVATLPALPDARLAAMAADARALAALVDGEAAKVAATLAQLAELYRAGRVVLEGWAIVASAAYTLACAIDEPQAGQASALAAARYELETLLPSTGASAPSLAEPDVPIASLVRRT